MDPTTLVRSSVRAARNLQLGWRAVIAMTCLQLLLLLVKPSQVAGRSSTLQEEVAPSSRRLQAYRDSTNVARHGPASESFQLSDGSWVDCVPIEQQIAAHEPNLQDHIIRMQPSSQILLNSIFLPQIDNVSDTQQQLPQHPQLFAREHGGCREGFIPVQRSDPNQQLFRKHQGPAADRGMTSTTSMKNPTSASNGPPHDYAEVAVPSKTGGYTGQGGVLSVNGPYIGEPSSEFSLSQLWTVAGSYQLEDLNTAEVGWHVYPAFHPSQQPLAPHLFIYWTRDAYLSTGCYNLNCPGFVQVDSTWVLGGALAPYTTLAQKAEFEYEFSIFIVFDSGTSGWWLLIQGTWVGYWPSSIYTTLQAGRADNLEWGGEIAPASTNPTTTGMGSGAFPSAGYPVAAYQRNVSYGDAASGNWYYASFSGVGVTNTNCYTVGIQQGGYTNWGSYFFFGGPGALNNPACANALLEPGNLETFY
jgi:hypothetical protein